VYFRNFDFDFASSNLHPPVRLWLNSHFDIVKWKFNIVYDQELVWSVAFFVGVWYCLGRLLTFVKCLVRSVAFAAVIWSWEPWNWHCPAVFLVSTCVVVPRACSVFIALLAWHCGLNYSGLAVLGIPTLPPLSFQHFFSTEPSGLSVMGRCL